MCVVVSPWGNLVLRLRYAHHPGTYPLNDSEDVLGGGSVCDVFVDGHRSRAGGGAQAAVSVGLGEEKGSVRPKKEEAASARPPVRRARPPCGESLVQ